MGYQILQTELQEKYNSLFRQTLDEKLTDTQRVHRLEQMKGVAVAMNLTAQLIETMKGEVDYEENLLEETDEEE